MNETNDTRCMNCPYIGYNTRLQYYPNYYCKINGREVHFCEKEGWDRMEWCPLKEEKNNA